MRLVAYCFALIVIALPRTGISMSASESLKELFKQVWEETLENEPLFATYVGDGRYNDRLPDVSPTALAKKTELRRKRLKRLGEISRKGLSEREQIDYDIFKLDNENAIADFDQSMHLMPVNSIWGFHLEFPTIQDITPFKTVKDYENYLKRLRAFPKYVEDHILLMQEGIRTGYVQPGIIFEGFETSLTTHLVKSPEKSVFFEPFKSLPQSISKAESSRLKKEAGVAILSGIVPGYQKFFDFMRKEYLPAANKRKSIGASDLPNGKELYQSQIRRHTTLNLSAEEIHELGLREVARIQADIGVLMKKVSFRGKFLAFAKYLRTAPKFYAKTPQQLLARTALVLKTIDGKLPKYFKTLPRMPYGIEPVPQFSAEKAPTAYYRGPKGDGTTAGTYFVNTSQLKSRPIYEIAALSLHEAVPGHHLQIALAQELEGIPEFRKYVEFNAFIEGWALYAEHLGTEMGMYGDPYDDYGRASYELWRACRLVVDTGMHAMGWSRDKAIQYLYANSGTTKHNIISEIDRYIGIPAQALSYKLGELKIKELRSRAEQKLGERFDIREFHDVVLGSGTVPLSVLEKNVENYYARSVAGGVSNH